MKKKWVIIYSPNGDSQSFATTDSLGDDSIEIVEDIELIPGGVIVTMWEEDGEGGKQLKQEAFLNYRIKLEKW